MLWVSCGEFVTGRRFHPLKPLKRPVPALDIHTVQKKHVEVDVEIQRTPKHWISVTALVWAVFLAKPVFLIRCVAMAR